MNIIIIINRLNKGEIIGYLKDIIIKLVIN